MEPQPQSSPSVTASRTATSASESTTAPSQSTRARSTGGEGGTSRCAANAIGSEMRLIQNSQLTSKLSTTMPASGRPMPAPIPNDALSSPIPAATLGRGKVSRITPKASGKTPPAMPWIARPAMTSADRRGQRGHDRAEREAEHHRGEHAALAEQVAELADDRRGHRGREQERGEHPGRRRRGGMRLARQLGQRRNDQRLGQGERDGGEEEHRQDLAGMLRRGGLGHRLQRVETGWGGGVRETHFFLLSRVRGAHRDQWPWY